MSSRSKPLLSDGRVKEMNSKPSTGEELVAAIRKLGLIGMWADRDDIRDSRKFARQLRKRASKRKVSDRAPA
jgi:hypothetical protein